LLNVIGFLLMQCPKESGGDPTTERYPAI
jgi:hypothetical protein